MWPPVNIRRPFTHLRPAQNKQHVEKIPAAHGYGIFTPEQKTAVFQLNSLRTEAQIRAVL